MRAAPRPQAGPTRKAPAAATLSLGALPLHRLASPSFRRHPGGGGGGGTFTDWALPHGTATTDRAPRSATASASCGDSGDSGGGSASVDWVPLSAMTSPRRTARASPEGAHRAMAAGIAAMSSSCGSSVLAWESREQQQQQQQYQQQVRPRTPVRIRPPASSTLAPSPGRLQTPPTPPTPPTPTPPRFTPSGAALDAAGGGVWQAPALATGTAAAGVALGLCGSPPSPKKNDGGPRYAAELAELTASLRRVTLCLESKADAADLQAQRAATEQLARTLSHATSSFEADAAVLRAQRLATEGIAASLGTLAAAVEAKASVRDAKALAPAFHGEADSTELRHLAFGGKAARRDVAGATASEERPSTDWGGEGSPRFGQVLHQKADLPIPTLDRFTAAMDYDEPRRLADGASASPNQEAVAAQLCASCLHWPGGAWQHYASGRCRAFSRFCRDRQSRWQARGRELHRGPRRRVVAA
eukprot:NODE_3300_length_2057_cov_2.041969.p1 GENE.NODE_3300_length_2057_cov_2.041969~~NODE_3300_length_2057_cov_2.041969.p1  ORF type:complete len:473 (-),score=116.92 NODE_3300_length_2057_cov_2.041969:245-1663(-)